MKTIVEIQHSLFLAETKLSVWLLFVALSAGIEITPFQRVDHVRADGSAILGTFSVFLRLFRVGRDPQPENSIGLDR
jgi:hypothetical protein